MESVPKLVSLPRVVGETKVTGKNQVTLPAQGMRELGWERGDQLSVKVVGGDTMVLTRRPKDWVEFYAGKMGDVFGDHEEVLRYLDEERRSWERE